MYLLFIVCYLITHCILLYWFCFFFKQKTAYEVRISDWSSDVCSSDLRAPFQAERARLAKAARGLFSPQRCVDAVEAAVDLPFDEGLKRERELIQQCMESPQRAGLVHAFFGEREVAKVPGMSKDVPVRPVRKAAVIGAGTMGGGIAMCFANAGIPVTLVETAQEALDRGLARMRSNYNISVRRGRLTAADVDARMASITPSLDLAAVADADMVIEAVFESKIG